MDKSVYKKVNKWFLLATGVVLTCFVFGFFFKEKIYVSSQVQKTQIQRDFQRLQDLLKIINALEDYRAEYAHYPKLEGGSYIQGVTISKWPSWEQNFGSALNVDLPKDPLNVLYCSDDVCSEEDTACQETCYSFLERKLSFDENSFVYLYQSIDNGMGYNLYAHLEYGNPNNWNFNCSSYKSSQECLADPWCKWESEGGQCTKKIISLSDGANVCLSVCPNSDCSCVSAFNIVYTHSLSGIQGCDYYNENGDKQVYNNGEYLEVNTHTYVCQDGQWYSSCGNGKVDSGEVCDGSSGVPEHAYCSSDCSQWFCQIGYRKNNSGTGCEPAYCFGIPVNEGEPCEIANGVGEYKAYCDTTQSPPTWKVECQVVSCNPGYRLYNNTCELDHCEGLPGIFKCNYDYNAWGKKSCTICNVNTHPPSWVCTECVFDKCKTYALDCDSDISNGCECGQNTECSGPYNASCVCKSGYNNCDGNWVNGCECGANTHCKNTDCECNDNYANCDGNWLNGCEINLLTDKNNCGKCGNQCAPNMHCENGKCVCDANYGDCNLDIPGCETYLLKNNEHCGVCNNKCGGSGSTESRCVGSNCVCVDSNHENCDGNWSNGCETNILTNINNCGKCGNQCGPNMECENGECVCDVNYENCDPDIPGCETFLGDSDNCGGCGDKCINGICKYINGKYQCECYYGVNGYYGNCDNSWTNGCETNLFDNDNNCGECGKVCGGLGLESSECSGLTCVCENSSYANCDNDWSNGCETNILTDKNNCGKCGNQCGPNMHCENRECVCDANWEDCNGNSSDGCEVYLLNNEKHCGSCDNECADNQVCVNGSCTFCGNGSCDIGKGENCSNCPDDCSCPKGTKCCGGECRSTDFPFNEWYCGLDDGYCYSVLGWSLTWDALEDSNYCDTKCDEYCKYKTPSAFDYGKDYTFSLYDEIDYGAGSLANYPKDSEKEYLLWLRETFAKEYYIDGGVWMKGPNNENCGVWDICTLSFSYNCDGEHYPLCKCICGSFQ